MKKILYILFACTLLTSCELETSGNGHLDGNWQLRQIDTLSTCGICDMSNSYIYWGVENNLLQIRDIDDGNLKIFFRFSRENNILTIHSPYRVITKDELMPVEDIALLQPLGITDTQDSFTIEKLSSGKLILQNDHYRFHFRKY